MNGIASGDVVLLFTRCSNGLHWPLLSICLCIGAVRCAEHDPSSRQGLHHTIGRPQAAPSLGPHQRTVPHDARPRDGASDAAGATDARSKGPPTQPAHVGCPRHSAPSTPRRSPDPIRVEVCSPERRPCYCGSAEVPARGLPSHRLTPVSVCVPMCASLLTGCGSAACCC